MKILVTGSTGFIGRHIVPVLLQQRHEITATARNLDRARSMPWFDKVKFVACDLHHTGQCLSEIFDTPDLLIHLAWTGLPNYRALFHFESNLPADYNFLKNMVNSGTKHLLVTGTCFEYGMQSGQLSEDMITLPANPYGLAKDTLRKILEIMQKHHPFVLQWLRLFYLYGPGQNPSSLIAQLDKAIDNAEPVFNMSGGEQLRDYLPVHEVARRIDFLINNPQCCGVINCCSGEPISVRRLVENRLRERGATLQLNLGYYPYPDYEPMAFWGDSQKLDNCMS
ncbi:MAG: NAD-dependent epimerase/dehydratase family protein [Desulfatirhabdiaceae bacterium]